MSGLVWPETGGNEMQTFAGFTTEFVPPLLSSFVSAWHWMYALQACRRRAVEALARAGVHDCPSRSGARELGLVDPVVERLAEIEHGKEKDEQDWNDERELDERHT